MKAQRRTRRLRLLVFFIALAAGTGTARATTNLDLLDGRFLVSAVWRTASGATGAAQAVPMGDETGLFWFFSPSNAELVVKVLDACAPPFGRFWFYAAGLTDVEVELTVKDTWTGQTKTYKRPPGSLFATVADTSSFGGCDVVKACGQGTRADIQATPRPNGEAEALALLLGPGITADPAVYARLDADLARIRTLWPQLAHVGFLLIWEPSSLLLELSPDAHAAAKAGHFTEADCLNAWYGGEIRTVFEFSNWAVLEFKGLFHPARIGADYEALPGVLRTETNGIGYPSGGPPPSSLCAAIDGAAYDYFLDDVDHGQVWYFRVPQAGALPVAVGNVGASQPRPDWWPRYQQCQDRLNEAALR